MTNEQLRKIKNAAKEIDRQVQLIQDAAGEEINIITMILSPDENDDFNKVNMIGTEFKIRQMLNWLQEDFETENTKKENENIENYKPRIPKVDSWVLENPPTSAFFTPTSLPKLPSKDEVKKYG